MATLLYLNSYHLQTDPQPFPLPHPLGGKQEEIVNSGIPKTDLAPNTPTSTQISVTGEI